MSKEKLTVSWIMIDEPLLKLKEPDETYDIAENVFNFIKENKLHEKDDFVAEVEIDKNEGENGTITYLKEVGGTTQNAEVTPTEEAPVDVQQAENLIVKELTVGGVSVAKKGVIFKEEDKVWYTLDDSIDAQEFKDKYTKRVVEVSIKSTEQGNDIIMSFTVKDDTPVEDTEKSTSQGKQKTNGNAMQVSIEAQASVNSANRLVAGLFDANTKPNDILKNITLIAQHNFQTIQDLKNK